MLAISIGYSILTLLSNDRQYFFNGFLMSTISTGYFTMNDKANTYKRGYGAFSRLKPSKLTVPMVFA